MYSECATVEFTVRPLFVPWGRRRAGRLRLLAHQEEVLENVAEGANTVVVAPTGAGKTATLLADSVGYSFVHGFVALYPNTTLLRNQVATLARLVELAGGIRVKDRATPAGAGYALYRMTETLWGNRYVAILWASGSMLSRDATGTKRGELRGLFAEVLRFRPLYLVFMTTPDTLLLVTTSAYRDFSRAGAALHNLLLAIASGDVVDEVLRRTGSMPRGSISPMTSLTFLHDMPLFVDEFHLYSDFEVAGLAGVLDVRELLGSEAPVVLASATPAPVDGLLRSYREVVEYGGDDGMLVRGRVDVTLHFVEVDRKGIGGFFDATEQVPTWLLRNVEGVLRRRRRVLAIMERLYNVVYTATRLAKIGIKPQCLATVKPSPCTVRSRVIVASEAASQGVNLQVDAGVLSAVGWEDAVQRYGRVGRRQENAEVHLFAPCYRYRPAPAEELDHYDLVTYLAEIYLQTTKRDRTNATLKLAPGAIVSTRRTIIRATALTATARITGSREALDNVITPEDATKTLDSIAGPPETLVRLLSFRRAGPSITIKLPDGTVAETSLATVARNFNPIRYADGILYVDWSRTRSRLELVPRQPAPARPFRGLVTTLSYLAEVFDAVLYIVPARGSPVPLSGVDAVVAVAGAGKLADLALYTGEAVLLPTPDGPHALVFV